MRKLLITGAAAGLLLVSAAGAFAFGGSAAFVDLHNVGSVTNVVNTSANTGNNSLTSWGHSGEVENSSILTGAAYASANLTSQVNYNQFDCGCALGLSGVHFLDLDLSNNGSVNNIVGTSANSGNNSATGHWGAEVEHVTINTGNATAGTVLQSVVNTNIFGSVTKP